MTSPARAASTTPSTLLTSGKPHRARDDGDMRGRGRIFEHQAGKLFAAVIEQLRRPHRARDQHGVVRQIAAAVAVACQMPQQAAREIFEIVQPLAQ